jgi:ribosomal protein S12 methylthiotransferase
MTSRGDADSASRGPHEHTVYLDTLGCEKNTVDSEGALGLLLERGFRVVDDAADASLIVLNTCGFLESARQESLERLRELAAEKGDGRLVAMGCLVQGSTHDLQREVPGVDAVLGVGQYDRLASLVAGGDGGPLGTPQEAPYAGYGTRVLLGPTHVAHLKIAEGCNQKCSFCKIPALRGPQRSRSLPELLAEAHGLVAQGVRELILISQNSSAWGIDLPGQPRLGDLCRALATITELKWIRIMYAYPPMLDRRLAEDVWSVDKVVDYLDIPVQHASPAVLQRMERGYDLEKFARQMEELRTLRPGIMLRSTALVGFPGETEDDVVRLLDFIDDIGFDHLATFAYSHEEQTASFAFVDDVDPAEKEDRRARVEAVQWDVGQARKQQWLGRRVEMVIDEVFEDADDALLDAVAIEAGDDPRPAWTGPVAFGRSEGFCYEIDGGIWLPAGGLAEGQFLMADLVGCGPHDFLATFDPAPGKAR